MTKLTIKLFRADLTRLVKKPSILLNAIGTIVDRKDRVLQSKTTSTRYSVMKEDLLSIQA